jgi:hypothetical protein
VQTQGYPTFEKFWRVIARAAAPYRSHERCGVHYPQLVVALRNER